MPPPANPQQPPETPASGQNRIIYILDRDLVRIWKVAALVLVVLFTFAVFFYLYGFHPANLPPPPGKVAYEVDQDLLRFAKFAAAVLTVFITVGLFLYGIDVKQVAKEVREAANSTRELQHQAMLTNDEIRKAKADIDTAKGEIDTAKAQIDSAKAEIQSAKEAVAEDHAESKRLLQRMSEQVAATESQREKLQSLQNEMEGIKETIQGLLQQTREDAEFAHSVRVSLSAPSLAAAPGDRKDVGYSVPELARLYDFPAEFDGHGQCIGLIELGGGYRDSDLKTYFAGLGHSVPKVTWVSVDGAENAPGGASGADSQVTLDIEVAGAVAPAAHIVLYFAPNTSRGFVDAVRRAISDTDNHPSVISISWGGPESSWQSSVIAALNETFQAAAIKGITVVCAVGDDGVTAGVRDGKPHVVFPASSPWVLGCGGTRLEASGQTILSESVWNEGTFGTGGGISDVFPLPDWQSRANVPPRKGGRHRGRGIPDVAASASPEFGYRVVVGGQTMVVGGTAAAAPLWAGLVALINQGLGRNVGYFHPLLYDKIGPGGILRSITQGNNSVSGVQGYSAGPGWNPCTGWGSPDGKKLLAAFRKLA